MEEGDYVKIPEDYSDGYTYSNGKEEPEISPYAGKEAVVIEGGAECGHYIRGCGPVWWFDADRLHFIESGRNDLLNQWENKAEEEIVQKSNLDWVFKNGHDVLLNPHGATISTLGNCLGMTNLWGRNGEGFFYYKNAMFILSAAEPFLKNGDKDGWLAFCSNF